MNLDFSIFKDIPLGEVLNAQFRAEFFNLTNTPQFGTPTTSVTSTNFMRVTSASGERQIRFGLRFHW